jgi:GxxExxY protein
LGQILFSQVKILRKVLIYKDEVYEIIGACMEVHRELGFGFHESVYQEALKIEFERRNITFNREKEINIFYKGKKLEKYYKADFICFNNILVEIKALSELVDDHIAQVINYLKATDLELGVLVNFGEPSLKYKRIIL